MTHSFMYSSIHFTSTTVSNAIFCSMLKAIDQQFSALSTSLSHFLLCSIIPTASLSSIKTNISLDHFLHQLLTPFLHSSLQQNPSSEFSLDLIINYSALMSYFSHLNQILPHLSLHTPRVKPSTTTLLLCLPKLAHQQHMTHCFLHSHWLLPGF